MIHRVFNDIFDVGRLVAVTELQTTVAWRKFAIVLSNSGQTHKYEGRMNTSEGVAVAMAHQELMAMWKEYDRYMRTFEFRNIESSLIYKLRNFHISMRAITAIEGVSAVSAEPKGEHVFRVWFNGRTEPVTVAAPGDNADKMEALRRDHAAVCKAWEEAMPAVVANRAGVYGV